MFGIFNDIGSFQGLRYSNYEEAYQKATELNMRYQQGLEDEFYHIEDIDDDELEDLDCLLDIDGDADLPF